MMCSIVISYLKIELSAELENPRVLHLGWLPPLGSEGVVDLHRAAAVEDVIDIQVALHAQPRRHPELLGETQVEPPDAMVVERAGHDERYRRRRRARRAAAARAKVATERTRDLRVARRVRGDDVRPRDVLEDAEHHRRVRGEQ